MDFYKCAIEARPTRFCVKYEFVVRQNELIWSSESVSAYARVRFVSKMRERLEKDFLELINVCGLNRSIRVTAFCH